MPPRHRRSLYARTDNPRGFKINQPAGWVSEGPVWWWGSDRLPADPQRSGHSAVTKATNIVVGTLTSGAWSTSNGEEPRWLTDPMLVRRDDRYGTPLRPAQLRLPAPYFWGQWIRSALLWGMGWLLYAPDEQGYPWPGSMYVLNPGAVSSTPDQLRVIHGQDGQQVEVGPEGQVDGTPFRLLELRNPLTPVDATTGITPGVLEYHAAELKLLGDMVSYAGGTFAGAGVPSGYLKVTNPNISKPQADAIKAEWMAAHGRSERTVAVLSATTDYQPIAVSPVDAGLADMTKLSLVSVANAFSIPYSLLGAPTGDSMTYSNLTMDLQALEFALMPWVRGVEETLSPLLPAGRGITIKITTQLPGGTTNAQQPAAGPVPPAAPVPAGDVPPR